MREKVSQVAQVDAREKAQLRALGADYAIAEVAPASPFIGKSLAELQVRQRFNVHVIAIQDVLTGKLAMAPPPDAKMRDTDVLVILGTKRDIETFQKVR